MKKKIKVEEEIDLAGAECWIHPRHWSTSEINGVEDDDDNPQMPLIQEHLGEKAWHIIVNLDTGQICNWPQGTKASIHYKSVDENYIHILDDRLGIVEEYEGYVPDFLCPKENGYGDYVIMDIDENGFIQNFNNNLDDIFDNEDED
ncbi:hypothetical protein [Lepagella muris]|uniref:Uncharacterized protein n=1 Tax=Lepagella muris TaxID=3032870 RepID=A0AC61RKJ8_9BACT|nr:hypothetical protein [Lepagella muris]TGY80904.1 hypothetical protein E5331_00565 [Lepagella muris]THG53982.1 hypothetical protein E5984_00565 [Bacteroidales bacterium]TKC57412.1 hypothetical protein E5359_012155 [Bacteroidales bacterium]